MFNYEEPISIDREMRKGEPENPGIALSRKKEELRNIEDRILTDAPSPDDEADMEVLKKEIVELEKIVYHKKAA